MINQRIKLGYYRSHGGHEIYICLHKMQIKIDVKIGGKYHIHVCKYMDSNGSRVSCGLITYDRFSLVSLIANIKGDNVFGYYYSCNIGQRMKLRYYCSRMGHEIYFSLHNVTIKIVAKNGKKYCIHDCEYKDSNGSRVSCGLITYDRFSLVSLLANTRGDNEVGYYYSCNNVHVNTMILTVFAYHADL